MEPQQPQGTIVIARGSGFLGTSLAHHLAEGGCKVIVLSRTPRTDKQASSLTHSIIEWDARSLGAWADCLNGASGIVNLVGRSVDCIKSPDHCDEILRSRVEATTVLGAAVRAVDQPPPVWLQMSTAHIYGDPPDVICDEDAAFGYGLAPLVGQAWEDACAKAVLPDMRTVILRTSFVIGRGGGALARLGRLARLGLGGTIGHGRQGMSWIHIHDMNRIFDRALTDQSIQGAYIASSPNPVSNRQFMKSLRKAVGMPIGLPAFAWMVKLDLEFVFFRRVSLSSLHHLRERSTGQSIASRGLGAIPFRCGVPGAARNAYRPPRQGPRLAPGDLKVLGAAMLPSGPGRVDCRLFRSRIPTKVFGFNAPLTLSDFERNQDE